MSEETDVLADALAPFEASFALASLPRVRELEEEMNRLRESRDLDPLFSRERLSSFEFAPPAEFAEARSILAVAVPQPAVRAFFEWRGEETAAIVPPTYRWRIDAEIEASLEGAFAGRGRRFAKAALPLKPLAVRSGLALYGRNNLCYVPGRGSFVRLAAFSTDVPCESDPWRDEDMMEGCARCSACASSCPSKCIPAEGFLLRAERCLAYLNEGSASDFPAWLDPASHRCLIGCMACQEVCPENRASLRRVEDAASFAEEETRAILDGTPLERLPPAAAEKLRAIDLLEDYGILPRNLRALFAASERAKKGTNA